MSRLKAWFISLSGLFVFAGLVHAVVVLSTAGTSLGIGALLAWSGVALANAPFSLTLTSFLLIKRPRTSGGLPLMLALTSLGAALAGAGTVLGDAGVQPVVEAGVGVLVSFVYVFWYSRLGRAPSAALVVGEPLPSLSFEDGSGEPLATDSLAGPLLMMFYRGNWCPFCSAQIAELAAQYRELETRGVTVLLISPQSHSNTKSIADRFDIPALFLVDVDHRAAKQLGIFHEGGLPAGLEVLGYDEDTVFPTVILTDAERRVIWADQTDNYRVRPEPDVFLAVLDGAPPRAAQP